MGQKIKQNNKPGPATYEKISKTGINRVGNYFLSKLHNSLSRSFTKEKKPNHQIRNKQIPGPGAYELTRLTDFGYYKGVGRQNRLSKSPPPVLSRPRKTGSKS